MTRTILAAMVLGGLAVAGLVFVVVLFTVKFLWAWTIPDLFPGAVAQGLITPTISWWTALKIALIIAILSGTFGGAHCRNGRD